MASKRKSLKKKALAKRRTPPTKKAPAKKAPTKKVPAKKAPAKSKSSAKAAATKGAAARAAEVKRLEKAAAKRYGRASQTTKRMKELTANARRWELEARKSKSLSAKKRARANATKALTAAKRTFGNASKEATHGQAKARGWYEVTRFDNSGGTADTFSSYEHARMGAGSVLSLLESRPGVVGITSWRRVSQVERDATGLTSRNELTPELQQRADAVAAELRLTDEARAEFDAMLFEAELYGVELELEVENYQEGAQ